MQSADMEVKEPPVGFYLRYYRRQAALTAPELSAITEIPTSRIYNIEAGRSRPTNAEVDKVLAACKVDYSSAFTEPYEQIDEQPGGLNVDQRAENKLLWCFRRLDKKSQTLVVALAQHLRSMQKEQRD